MASSLVSPTTQNMEKITTQLHVQAILNRLDSVETKLGKLEGLFQLLEKVETAVSKNYVDLNNMNEKTKAIQNNVEEIEKGIVFAKSQTEELIQKDEKNIKRIKDLVDKLLYQEIWLYQLSWKWKLATVMRNVSFITRYGGHFTYST